MRTVNNVGRGLATIGAAIACAAWMHHTDGESGIGWFLVSLLFIW